jgi:probable rRNA maturation factor
MLAEDPAAAGRGGLCVVLGSQGGAGPSPGLGRWLTRIAPLKARGIVTVALVSEGKIRELNRRYRRHNSVTDVLSFPAHEGARRGRVRSDAWLGDIVISRAVAKRQARAAGHSPETEVRVLALHGLLHLLGYDHARDGGRMRRAEMRLRRKGGLREGLIERAGRTKK